MKKHKPDLIYIALLLLIPVCYIFVDRSLYYLLKESKGAEMISFWKMLSCIGDIQFIYIGLMATGLVFFIADIFLGSRKPALVLLPLYSYFATTLIIRHNVEC